MTGKPKRAATLSDKAKKTAAIAATESKDDEKQKAKKPRGRPRKKAIAVPEPEPEPDDGPAEDRDQDGDQDGDEDGDEDEDGTDIDGIQTRRRKEAFSHPPGSVKRSDGKPKSDYQYLLAVKCFATHPKYMEAFSKAILPKDKAKWTNKIKNRLKVLTDKTRIHIKEMGQTGAGIVNEEGILPGTVLTTRWDEIKAKYPWFFHMRALIGARPSLQPVGLGNNNSVIDMSLLLSQDAEGDRRSSPDDTQDLPDPSEHLTDPRTDSIDRFSPSSSDDDEIPPVPTLQSAAASKRKKPPTLDPQTVKSAPKKAKTKPRTSTSAPTTAKTPAAKPKTVMDRFTATVLAEEEPCSSS
ncbi:hypothetical protein B0H10DRAFT_2184289 [Mycena sp. CBHHK59/15]|nr:hypothetical protein B0H10DRAFT_2184289 [Mycena sp. CBHHK59/15]